MWTLLTFYLQLVLGYPAMEPFLLDSIACLVSELHCYIIGIMHCDLLLEPAPYRGGGV